MQGLFAAILVLIGILAVTIGVWTATTKPPLFRMRNACRFGAYGVIATVVLLLTATWIRDDVFTTAMIILLS